MVDQGKGVFVLGVFYDCFEVFVYGCLVFEEV